MVYEEAVWRMRIQLEMPCVYVRVCARWHQPLGKPKALLLDEESTQLSWFSKIKSPTWEAGEAAEDACMKGEKNMLVLDRGVGKILGRFAILGNCRFRIFILRSLQPNVTVDV